MGSFGSCCLVSQRYGPFPMPLFVGGDGWVSRFSDKGVAAVMLVAGLFLVEVAIPVAGDATQGLRGGLAAVKTNLNIPQLLVKKKTENLFLHDLSRKSTKIPLNGQALKLLRGLLQLISPHELGLFEIGLELRKQDLKLCHVKLKSTKHLASNHKVDWFDNTKEETATLNS